MDTETQEQRSSRVAEEQRDHYEERLDATKKLYERLMTTVREQGFEVVQRSERGVIVVGAKGLGSASPSLYGDTISIRYVNPGGGVSTEGKTQDDLPLRLDVERRCFVALDGGDALDVLMQAFREVCSRNLSGRA